jgi:hypothetical protein
MAIVDFFNPESIKSGDYPDWALINTGTPWKGSSNSTYLWQSSQNLFSWHPYESVANDFTSGLKRVLATAEKHATLSVGMWLKPEGQSGGPARLVMLKSDTDTTICLTVRLTSDGVINVFKGEYNTGVSLGSYTSTMTTSGPPRHFQIKAVMSTTVGSVEIKLDGVTVLNLTNVDTRNGATATTYDTVYMPFSCTNTGITGFYDWWLTNGTTGFLGAAKVAIAALNANGDQSMWTNSGGTSLSNYSYLNDLNNATFVSAPAGSSTLYDSYNIAEPTISTGYTFGALKVSAVASVPSGTPRDLALGVRQSTTNNVLAETVSTISNQYFQRVMPTNPISATTWTNADISTVQPTIYT